MNGSQFMKFQQDPVAFLNPSKTHKKGVDLNITGADGTLLQTSTATVPNAPRPLQSSKKQDYSSFDMKKFKTETIALNLAYDASHGVLNMSKDPVATTKHVVQAYFLNWATDKGYWMQLGSAANLFVTARLNGCGVLIYGLPSSPTVVHANIKRENLLDFPEDYDPFNKASLDSFNKQRMDIFHRFYSNLAFGLTDAGIFNPTRLSPSGLDDSGAVSKLFEPSFYFAKNGSYAHLFGLKDSSDNWSFYWHYMKNESTGVSFECGHFWP
jgi:hypothetical protein